MARFDVPVGDEILTVEANDPESAKTAAEVEAGKPATGPVVALDAQAAQPATPTGLPPLVQDAAQALTMPARGMRGLGVGIEQMASQIPAGALLPGAPPMNPQEVGNVMQAAPEALQRAAAAVKPDYVAQEGEKLGAFAGETIGSLPLAYATGGMAGANAALRVKMAYSAVSAGTMAAIDQASKRGDVNMIETGIASGVGGLVPVIGPTLKAIGRMLFGAGPLVAAKVGVKPYAIEELRNDPELLKNFEGSAEAVGKKVVAIQTALKDVYDASAKNLKKVRAKYNLPDYFEDGKVSEEALAALEEGKFEPDAPEDLVKRFRFLREQKGMSPEAKIRSLVELRDKVRASITYGKSMFGSNVRPITGQEESILKGMASDINTWIWDPETKIGISGGETLRKAEGAYSETRNIYDNLQKKLSDEATGEATLARVAYNDNIDEIIGRDSATDKMIKWLEDKTGKSLMKPLRQQLASKAIKEMRPPGNQGFFGSGIGDAVYGTGPTGLKNTVGFLDATSRGAVNMGEAFFDPRVRMAMIAAAANQAGGQK